MSDVSSLSIVPADAKACTTCLVVKPTTEFHKKKQNRANSGLDYRCKGCASEHHKEYNKLHPNKKRGPNRYKGMTGAQYARLWRLKRYGISLAQFDAMLEAQDGKCAVCGSTSPGGKHGRFAVDHNHATGVVRGLLCWMCNAAIGMLRDSPDAAAGAARYLTKWRGK